MRPGRRATLEGMDYQQPPQWSDPTQQRSASPAPGAWPGVTPRPPYPAVTASDERLFATLAHLSAAIAWVVSAGWLNFVGPLIVWALYRDRSAFVRKAAAGSFNFTLGMTIAGIVGWVLVFTIILAPLGFLLIALSGVLAIVLGCVGALRTWRGQSYTYPWQFRVLS